MTDTYEKREEPHDDDAPPDIQRYRCDKVQFNTASPVLLPSSMLVLQAVLISLYLFWREPGQMTLVVRHWRSAAPVGLSGMLASAGWFSAMTLQNAAYVKAVGQLELVFALLASTLLFRERIVRGEVIGIVLIVLGIMVLLIAG